LFPVSLLTRAKVRSASAELGTCVDAMAGCQSGQVAYVMVSEGGIAGAGETLRPVPWSELRAEGEELITTIGPEQFCSLQPVPKDQWPSR
jgi:hypothetical protein